MRTSARPPLHRPSPRAGAAPARRGGARRRSPWRCSWRSSWPRPWPPSRRPPRPAPRRRRRRRASCGGCPTRRRSRPWPRTPTRSAPRPGRTTRAWRSRPDPGASQGAPFAQAKRVLYGPAPLLCAQAGTLQRRPHPGPRPAGGILVVAGPVPAAPASGRRFVPNSATLTAITGSHSVQTAVVGTADVQGLAARPDLPDPGRLRRLRPGRAGDLRPGHRPVPAGRARHRRPDRGRGPADGLRGDRPVPAVPECNIRSVPNSATLTAIDNWQAGSAAAPGPVMTIDDPDYIGPTIQNVGPTLPDVGQGAAFAQAMREPTARATPGARRPRSSPATCSISTTITLSWWPAPSRRRRAVPSGGCPTYRRSPP